MKRCVCLILVVLFLAGCRSLYPEDYISVESNQAPYAYRDTTQPENPKNQHTNPTPRTVTVSTISEIRMGIQNLFKTGVTSGRFLLRDYRGDREDLPKTVRNHLDSVCPKYVYAMKLLELTTESVGKELILNVNYQPAMTLEEFSEIASCRYSDAIPLIYDALRAHHSSYTVEIIGYTDTDFSEMLDSYSLAHPNEMVEIPQIKVELYPKDEGLVRVAKFSFLYNTDQDTLEWQQKTVSSMLESYQPLFREDDNPKQLLDTLYLLLIPAGGYQDDKDATAYSLILLRVGSSRMMASVAAYLYSQAGKDCGIVVGEHCVTTEKVEAGAADWEPWYWNWIWDGDKYLFFDLHAAALNGVEPSLLAYEEMTEYRWDPDQYPQFEPSGPTEAEEETGPEEANPTEPPTEEPTDNSTEEPTENSPEEPTEATSVTP